MASTQLQCSSYKQYFFVVGKFRCSMLCLHCLKRATKFLMQVILYDVYFLKLSLFAVHRVTPIYSTPKKTSLMNCIIDEACHCKFCLTLYMNDDLKLNEIVHGFQHLMKNKVYLFRKCIMFANLAYNM